MLQLQHVHAGYANRASALQSLNLEVRAGEQIALIGPSGAGKSTLLQVLACAHAPQQGSYTLFGQRPWDLPHGARHQLRRQLFLAPQTPPLPPRQRVVTAVLAGRLPAWSVWQALRSLIRPQQAEAAWRALERFGLADKLYARVDQLSGGERQRCALARLLLSEARLLLVDEPLAALDPAIALRTLESLQQEARQRQATLICSLHQVALARSHFARIVGLRDGKIVFDCASPDDAMIEQLYRDAAPASPPDLPRAAHGAPLCTPDDPRCF